MNKETIILNKRLPAYIAAHFSKPPLSRLEQASFMTATDIRKYFGIRYGCRLSLIKIIEEMMNALHYQEFRKVNGASREGFLVIVNENKIC